MTDRKFKTAVLLTGAAARISQEVAILDQLMAKRGLRLSPDETLLAGFSSGALNIAAINACFGNSGGPSWDRDYKPELFQLTTEQVYRIHWKKPLPLDTRPLRVKITGFLERSGFHNIGDLPFHSFLLVFSQKRLETYWASSSADDQKRLVLADLLMASTAIPFVFPTHEIRSEDGPPRNFPDGRYGDGGTMGMFKGFDEYLGRYVIENGPFEKMYIISPMWGLIMKEVDEVFKYLEKSIGRIIHSGALQDFMNRYSIIGFNSFLAGLRDWGKVHPPIAEEILVCKPEMPRNFPLLNFNQQKLQYDAVYEWFERNPGRIAIPLDDYLQAYSAAPEA